MTEWALVIAAIAALATGAGAIFTWVQASTAVQNRKDAQSAQARAESARDEALALSRKATAAAERQAAAQEEANRLELEARRPATWIGPTQESKSIRAWRNNSGSPITIRRVRVIPPSKSGLVRLRAPESTPGTLPANASLRVLTIRAAGGGPELLEVDYEVEGTEGLQSESFPLS